MPDLLEHIYCSQQINIPPNLPYILKQYAKAAIRTQPYDLLFWSAAYFRAKANNLPPPVKERMEYPPFDSPSRLSPGFLRVLHKQLGSHEYLTVEVLYEKWLGVCLVKEALDSMLKIGNIKQKIPWLQFVSIAAGHLCDSLSKTMVMVCEVLTDQPDGGAAWIPVEKFVQLYEYLARLDCGPDPPQIKKVELYVPTPSATSTQVTSSALGKGETVAEDVEKDSTVGLMVWPDIKPQEKADRVQSPKYEEEPGATSEYGIEVFTDAKGPATELVTLYPAPTKTKTQLTGQRAVTIASESGQRAVTTASETSSRIGTKPRQVESEGESILSHSSLKENEDWIKVESKNVYDEARESETLDLDKLISSAANSKLDVSGKGATVVEEKPDKEGAEVTPEDQIGNEPSESIELQQEDTTTLTSKEVEEKPSEEISDDKIGLEAASSKDLQEGAPSQDSLGSLEKTVDQDEVRPKKTTFESTDSEYELNQAITMTNFVGTRDVGYSVVEIRKGRVGDQSVDQIDSQAGPLASPTVHRLSVDSDESSEGQNDSQLPYWDHVPGIGPKIPDAQILAVVEYMQYWASKQQGMVGPRNINHLLCPPLDLPPVPKEEESIY